MSVSRKFAKWFSNYDNPKSPAARLRAKRIAPLLNMIESIYKNKGSVSIIDLGGTEKYWRIVSSEYLSSHHVNITIVNLPGSGLPENHGPFSFVEADACNLTQFADHSFDIAHSNSVVEHVGDWDRMVKFAKEVRRVAKSYFVQTPNYWFFIEPHCMTPFFHWLPKPIRVWLVLHFQLGHWRKADSIVDAVYIVESARLLDKKMFQALFPDATILTERYFLSPKSLVAIKH
ncbi:MAG: hypothetical protein Kow0088_05600 [Anaerolineales bacterium]